MKAPEEIAHEAYGQKPDTGWAVGSSEIVPMITAAIEADRARRDLYQLIIEALEERAELGDEDRPRRAAQAIRDGAHDDVWDLFIGPMLDGIEPHCS